MQKGKIMRKVILQLLNVPALVIALAIPAQADNGNGQGNARTKSDCDRALEVYQDDQRLWRRDASQLQAMPGTERLNRGEKNEANGLALQQLIPDGQSIRMIEVRACRGKVHRIPVADLQHEKNRYFVVPSRRGEFKLVVVHPNGKPESLLKRVTRIVLQSAAPAGN